MFAHLFESSRAFWQQHAPAVFDTPARRNARLGAMAARFVAALSDLAPQPEHVLRARILRARCPADLWHLRLDLFNAVAKACGQSVAQVRLRELDGLFTPRSRPAPASRRRPQRQ